MKQKFYKYFLLVMLLAVAACQTAPKTQNLEKLTLEKPDFIWDPYDLSSGESPVEKIAVLPIEIELDRAGCRAWHEGELAISRVEAKADGTTSVDSQYVFRFGPASKVLHIQYWTEIGAPLPKNLKICPGQEAKLEPKDCFENLPLVAKVSQGLNPVNRVKVSIPDCRFQPFHVERLSLDKAPAGPVPASAP